MIASIYYNEFDLKKAAMLKQLMGDGHIPEGDIDTRSIKEVKANEIRHYRQAHFFAGIGLWTYALKLAEWPSDRPVWTGSCPCQPFSSAGRKKGAGEDRHLWPYWHRLIKECQPSEIFGEQVASAIAYGWLDTVAHDLEEKNYSIAAAVLPACAVGSPSARNRLWFVAKSAINDDYRDSSEFSSPQQSTSIQRPRQIRHAEPSSAGFMGDPELYGFSASDLGGRDVENVYRSAQRTLCPEQFERAGPAVDVPKLWRDTTWLACPDGRYRSIKPGIRLLVNGYPHHDAIIHAIGDGIVPQVAAEFIKASL